jgi:hypothetical protein
VFRAPWLHQSAAKPKGKEAANRDPLWVHFIIGGVTAFAMRSIQAFNDEQSKEYQRSDRPQGTTVKSIALTRDAA